MNAIVRALRLEPYGLGGLLWLFGIPMLLLPLQIASATLAFLWSLPYASWPTDIPSPGLLVGFEIGMLLILVCSVIATEVFFRSSRHFPGLASAVILAGCLVLPLDDLALREGPFEFRELMDALLLDSVQWFVALVVLLYLRLSRRVRNTFGGPPQASSRTGLARWLLEGPYGWSGGVWLVVGALILMPLYHITEAWSFIEPSLPSNIASERLVEGSMAQPGTAGALLAAISAGDIAYIPFARAHLLQHATGAALALWAAFLFARRSPRMSWPFAGSVVLKITSGFTAVAADKIGISSGLCFDCSLPEDDVRMILVSSALTITALFLPAVRRRTHLIPKRKTSDP